MNNESYTPIIKPRRDIDMNQFMAVLDADAGQAWGVLDTARKWLIGDEAAQGRASVATQAAAVEMGARENVDAENLMPYFLHICVGWAIGDLETTWGWARLDETHMSVAYALLYLPSDMGLDGAEYLDVPDAKAWRAAGYYVARTDANAIDALDEYPPEGGQSTASEHHQQMPPDMSDAETQRATLGLVASIAMVEASRLCGGVWTAAKIKELITGPETTEDQLASALMCYLGIASEVPSVRARLFGVAAVTTGVAQTAFRTAVRVVETGDKEQFHGGNASGQILLIIGMADIIAQDPAGYEALRDACRIAGVPYYACFSPST